MTLNDFLNDKLGAPIVEADEQPAEGEEQTQDEQPAEGEGEEGEDKSENEINISEDNLKNIYNTQLKRLAYLKYLIDKEKDKDNKDKLTDIYDALKDLSFDDGQLRSISDLMEHIREIQRENNGKVPGLPSDDILQSLDTKMLRFAEYDPDTLNDLIEDERTKLKFNKDDSEDDKDEKESDADKILNNPDETEDDQKDILKELSAMEDANKGLCRALCLIDITSGLDVKKVETPEDDKQEPEELSAEEGDDEIEELKDLNDNEKEAAESTAELVEAYLDSYDGDEYDEADVDAWLEASKVLDKMDDEQKKNFVETFKQNVQSGFEGDDEEEVQESIKVLEEEDKNANRATMGDRLKSLPRRAVRTMWNIDKFAIKASFFLASGPVGIAVGAVVLHKRKKKKQEIKKMAGGLKNQIANEKDPKKKAELQKQYDNVMMTCFDSKGKPHHRPKLNKLPKEERAAFSAQFGKDISNAELKASGEAAGYSKRDFSKDKDVARKHKRKEGKEQSDSGDSGEEKKDENGYVVKDEEITDPETGKKMKVKTYTGPRGGKFYYPDGKPKTPENKVYVESLCDYLKKSMI